MFKYRPDWPIALCDPRVDLELLIAPPHLLSAGISGTLHQSCRASEFLTDSQVMLMLPVWGTTLE